MLYYFFLTNKHKTILKPGESAKQAKNPNNAYEYWLMSSSHSIMKYVDVCRGNVIHNFQHMEGVQYL